MLVSCEPPVSAREPGNGNSEWIEQGGEGQAPALGGCGAVRGPICLPTFQNVPQLSLLLPRYLLTKYLFYQQQQLPDDWGRPEVTSRGEGAHCPQDLNGPSCTPYWAGVNTILWAFPQKGGQWLFSSSPWPLLRNNILKVMETCREKAHLKWATCPLVTAIGKSCVCNSSQFSGARLSELETPVNESFHKHRLPLGFPKAGFQTLKSICSNTQVQNNFHKKNACIGFSFISSKGNVSEVFWL